VLLPALAGALRTSYMAKSQNNMKQIAQWMRLYSGDNREYIVPSQFDYSGSAATGYPVKVRSDATLGALRYKGTWTDILWTVYKLNTIDDAAAQQVGAAAKFYQFDSPDKAAYDGLKDLECQLRSAAANSHDFVGATGNGPTPFGNGAQESTLPGFFAANNFF